ncbi:MAG: NUMOD1 domain-containing DNA-binding protein [Niabella sp.]
MAVPENHTIPAYLDTSLEDRSGEQWDEIPGLDGYYQISNWGRVKRVEREIYDSQGGRYILPAKIRLAQTNHSPNRFTHDDTLRLQVAVQVQNKKHSFMVHRMVYYCFVAPFDLDDNKLNVVAKDGNGLNVLPNNLLLVTAHEKCRRTYEAGRLPSPSEISPDNIEKAVKASTAVTSIQVSQYDLTGRLIRTYKSIQDAARATHIQHSTIAYKASHPQQKSNRFYWRFGTTPFIDMQQLNKDWSAHHRKAVGKGVTKFDLDGNPLAYYDALSEAARENSISHKSITLCAKGITEQACGYRWKLGRHTSKLPALT